MSLTGTCRSEGDKSRHGPVKAFDCGAEKGTQSPVGGRATDFKEAPTLPACFKIEAFTRLAGGV